MIGSAPEINFSEMMTSFGLRARYYLTTASGLSRHYEVTSSYNQEDVKRTGKVLDSVQLDIVNFHGTKIRSLQRLNDDLTSSHGAWQHQRSGQPVAAPSKEKEATPAKSFFSFSYPNFSEARIRAEEYSSSQTTSGKTSNSLPAVKGLYLWGGSGCGKTYLSDLFYNQLPIQEKSKAHFHEFMAGIQRDLFRLEKV